MPSKVNLVLRVFYLPAPWSERVCKKNMCVYSQNSSTLQISHRVLRNQEKMPSKKHKKTRSSFKHIRTENYITMITQLRHWLVVIANRNQTFLIRHKGTRHEKFVPSRRMSNILTYVQVALVVTSDVQSILQIPATDEIHMEDRNHGLA